MKFFLQICSFVLYSLAGNAQYTVSGNAFRENCSCYTLTQNQNAQSGSVWNNNRINLAQSFDFTFDVFLGCNDAGADGISFVLQPISTSVGSSGGGMGYSGVSPAVGVTLDTYQNTVDNDPTYDHIAIQLNGNINHSSANTLTPLTPISATNNNVEDCQTHLLKIVWDAPSTTLMVFFDGVQRVTAVRDLVTTVFGGNTQVFWGFTGATGGLANLQRFCTSLLPKFRFLPTQNRCIGEPIVFNDSTITFGGILKRYWNFGDGSPIDSVNTNPTHTYAAAGDYAVTLTVLALDSCVAVFNQTVKVGSKPIADFTISDNCIRIPSSFEDISTVAVGTINTYWWDLDEGVFTNTDFTSNLYNSIGTKTIRHSVVSLEGCASDTVEKTVQIRAFPIADFSFTDSLCLGSTFTFTDQSTLVDGPITRWIWYVDGVEFPSNPNPYNHVFTTPGLHTISLRTSGVLAGGATPTNYCASDLVTKPVFVLDKPRAAIKSVQACESKAIQLLDSSYTNDGLAVTGWWWDLGNGQFSTQKNPTVTYANGGPVQIKLVVYNSRNCKSDTLKTTIQVGYKPISKFGHSTLLCNSSSMQFFDSSAVQGGTISQWQWLHNNTVFSAQQNPAQFFPPGTNSVGLVVISNYGCKSDTAYKTFIVKSKPVVTMNFADACKLSTVNFAAAETTSIGMSNWYWSFGDGSNAMGNPVTHVYSSNNTYSVKLVGISVESCSSDTITSPINIYGTNAFAGNDTIAAAGQPVQLNASGGLSYTWSPVFGLSNPNVANPLATNNTTQTYLLKAFTPEGCESFDEVTIKIYKGPDIYLPNAFTPNEDGLNDVFKGIPVGIKEFKFLRIFNRWGQEVFSTKDYNKGWDGRWKGIKQDKGVFVVMAAGLDFNGKPINKKTTVMLIR